MYNNNNYGGRIRTNGRTIKCRGYSISTHEIPNTQKTLTRSFFKGATVFLSCDEPIAIKYNDGRAIMVFKKLGNITLENRKVLRECCEFETVMEKEFNSALFLLLSKM